MAEGDRLANQVTKLSLLGAFLAIVGGFSTRRMGNEATAIRPFDLLLLGLATYRTGRVVAFEQVAEPVRAPFTTTEPDSFGTGEDVVPRGVGIRRAFGELMCCPLCVGTWVALGLVLGLHLAPRPTRAFLAVMSATGIAELLHSSTEALTWTGLAARKQAGS